jgi:hypothetical protein
MRNNAERMKDKGCYFNTKLLEGSVGKKRAMNA